MCVCVCVCERGRTDGGLALIPIDLRKNAFANPQLMIYQIFWTFRAANEHNAVSVVNKYIEGGDPPRIYHAGRYARHSEAYSEAMPAGSTALAAQQSGATSPPSLA